MQFKNTVSFKKAAMVLLAVAGLTSCKEMKEDLDPCPQGLSVEFVYDYNVERADMFPDHVGSVTLYVYDEAGRYVTEKTDENTAANPNLLRDKNYRMSISDLQPGTYRLLALANQRPYAQTIADGGIRYLRTEKQPLTDMAIDLHHLTDPTANTAPVYRQQLDTLWWGSLRSVSYGGTRVTRAEEPQQMLAQTVTVREGEITNCVVSLIRDTKRLHISIRQSDDPGNCDIADYDIRIDDVNTRLLYNNEVDTVGQPRVTYLPFDEWNTYYSPSTGQSYYSRPEGDDVEEAAHADLDFNRLMQRPATSTVAPAMLTITHRKDGKEVARINLPEILAQGRGAFERDNYSAQEFLDRCYDYHLDFILVGGEWRYMTLHVHTLPWTMRFQNVNLE